jgi:AraC-like DNA-binding protein
MTARADQFLEFYLQGRHGVVGPATGAIEQAPAAVIVGPQTFRGYDLHVAGRSRWVAIHFVPGGLHRVFGIPVDELADCGVPAVDVGGRPMGELGARLIEGEDDDARVALLDSYLRRALRRRARGASLLSPAVAGALATGRDVADVARESALSVRQLERRFRREAGLPPKLFSRIMRLQRAITWRERHPGVAWSHVAHATGYADQMHLVRDFRALTGETPTGFERASTEVDRALRRVNDMSHSF